MAQRGARHRRFAPAPSAALLVLATAMGSIATSPTARAAAPPGLPPFVGRHLAAMQAVDSLQRAGRGDLALARLAPICNEARAAGDRAALGFLLRVQGQLLVTFGRPRDAEAPLREAVVVARATRDSTLLVRGLTWLMAALGEQGRHDAAEALALQLLDVGVARGSTAAEGTARLRLAYGMLLRGERHDALATYREAVRLLALGGDGLRELDAWLGLGNAHAALGAQDSARFWYLRVADSSRTRRATWIEAHAQNNLGTLEFATGDPAVALRHFERARDLQLGGGFLANAVTPAVNVAIALKHMGRLGEARVALEAITAECERQGIPSAQSRNQLAGLSLLARRPAEAAALYRRVLADPGPPAIHQRVDALIGLAGALAKQDSAEAAERLLDGAAPGLAGRIPADRLANFEVTRGDLLLALGEPGRARARFVASEAAAHAGGNLNDLPRALAGAARADLALGEPERALARLERAAAAWEAVRDASTDPEWRAARGQTGRVVYGLLARVLLETPHAAAGDASCARAFDALQRFKVRGLHERIVGPHAGAWEAPAPQVFRPVTLARVQRDVLRERELLLDAFVGADAAYLFAITRETCRAVRLPGEDSLAVGAERLRALLGSPPGVSPLRSESEWRRAGAGFGAVLFTGIDDLVRASEWIVFSPDAALNRVPLGALALPGPGDAPTMLAATHEIQIVPSATFLAERRRAGDGATEHGVTVLAVAGLRDAHGRTLRGAQREAITLGRRFLDVDVRMGRADSALAAPDLGRYDLLHLSSHTSVDDERPWRSGVVLGGTAGNPRVLRAAEIAGLALRARLAVLSGCESAGAHGASGEGFQGLSAAFLCAGVPTVVATLWPVDDDATALFVDAFYKELARGRTAGGALGSARAEFARTRRFAHPFYWAGFVLVGDADVRVPLQRRPSPAVLPWAIGGVALLATAALLGRRRRRRSQGAL